MIAFIEHKTLREGVSGVTPHHNLPMAGPHLPVYNAITNIYLLQKKVFAGDVQQILDMAEDAGIDVEMVRNGFNELVNLGILTIENGVFTPTEKYVLQFH